MTGRTRASTTMRVTVKARSVDGRTCAGEVRSPRHTGPRSFVTVERLDRKVIPLRGFTPQECRSASIPGRPQCLADRANSPRPETYAIPSLRPECPLDKPAGFEGLRLKATASSLFPLD